MLGISISLFGRKSGPLHRSLIVLWNTSSFAVHHTQIELGTGIPMYGNRLELTQSSSEVPPAVSFVIGAKDTVVVDSYYR